MCALWTNEDMDLAHIEINAFDIENDDSLVNKGVLSIDRIYSLYSQVYYDKRVFDDDVREGILIGLDGLEKYDGKVRNKPLYNENVVGYMIANTSGFDNPDLNSGFLIGGRYDGNGFYVRKDNYLEKLPMFCAARYITYNRKWTERARIMKSADGADKFFNDVKSGKLNQFLLKCLVFTCFEMQNHLRTFKGTDKRFYRNELCLEEVAIRTGRNTNAVLANRSRTANQSLPPKLGMAFARASTRPIIRPDATMAGRMGTNTSPIALIMRLKTGCFAAAAALTSSLVAALMPETARNSS